MGDDLQRKGLDDYRREVTENAGDEKLRTILEKYAIDSVDIEQLLPRTRSILADCLMLTDSDKNIASKKIRGELKAIRKRATDLERLLSAAYPDTVQLLEAAAANDDCQEASHFEQSALIAKDERLQNAKAMIWGLSEWAGKALEGHRARESNRPKLITPSYARARLAGLDQRLTLRRPTRSSIHSREHPYGQKERGEFGRFSDDLLALIGMKLSDEAKKDAIANIKAKSSPKSD